MNPRAAINDLLPFQGSPFGQLGYFSITARYLKSEYYYTTRIANCLALIFTFFNFFSPVLITDRKTYPKSFPVLPFILLL